MIEGQCFEVPSRFGHVERLSIRYARWDLSRVDLWDPAERVVLARLLPEDKSKNADGVRRGRAGERRESPPLAGGIALLPAPTFWTFGDEFSSVPA